MEQLKDNGKGEGSVRIQFLSLLNVFEPQTLLTNDAFPLGSFVFSFSSVNELYHNYSTKQRWLQE